MRFPFKRSFLVASMTLVVTVVSGCSSNEPMMPEPELPEVQRGMDVGVNYIEPSSDIVIMDPSYQHVVLPDGAKVAYRPGWEDEAMDLAAKSLDDAEKPAQKIQKIGPNSNDVKPGEITMAEKMGAGSDMGPKSLDDLPSAEESDDPIYKAWRKLCEMKPEDLTRAELQIVLHNAMPEELEGLCEEGRNWLAELK